jgi:hypothetical protein
MNGRFEPLLCVSGPQKGDNDNNAHARGVQDGMIVTGSFTIG